MKFVIISCLFAFAYSLPTPGEIMTSLQESSIGDLAVQNYAKLIENVMGTNTEVPSSAEKVLRLINSNVNVVVKEVLTYENGKPIVVESVDAIITRTEKEKNECYNILTISRYEQKNRVLLSKKCMDKNCDSSEWKESECLSSK